MQQIVRDIWLPWNAQFEGHIPCMYLDIKGLVTTGTGQLIDPLPAALHLAWVDASGHLATIDQIAAEWNAVKANLGLAHEGARAAMACTSLRLPEAVMDAAAMARLDRNEAILLARPAFAYFDSWPADAQLGLLSMAWAMGAAFAGGWPRFCSDCVGRDWLGAAETCLMDASHNAGLVARNAANVAAFKAAAVASDATILSSWKLPAGQRAG